MWHLPAITLRTGKQAASTYSSYHGWPNRTRIYHPDSQTLTALRIFFRGYEIIYNIKFNYIVVSRQPTMLKVPIVCLLFQAFFITPSAFVSPGNTVKALYSNKAKALYKEGMLCIKSGRLNAAEQCFSAAIRKDSGFTAAYLQLGNVYVLMHDLQIGRASCRERVCNGV